MPGRFGSIAASRRGGGGEPGELAARRAGSARRRDERLAQRVDELVEEGREVPAALLELVEDGDPGAASPLDEGVDEAVDGLGVGKAEQVADASAVEPLGADDEELVEHRLGVAHPAGGQAGDEADRLGVGLGRRRRGSRRACPRSRRSSAAGTSKRWTRDRTAGAEA